MERVAVEASGYRKYRSRTTAAPDTNDEISAFSQPIGAETFILKDSYLRDQERFLGLVEWRHYLDHQ